MKQLNIATKVNQIMIALVLVFVTTLLLQSKSYSQQQIGYYPNMDGGLENQPGGTLPTKIDTIRWYYSTNGAAATQAKTVTTTGGYGGPKFVTVGRLTANLTSSTSVSTNSIKTTTLAPNTLYVVSFFYRANIANAVDSHDSSYIYISPDGTSGNRMKTYIKLQHPNPTAWTFFTDTVRTNGVVTPTTSGCGGINIKTSVLGSACMIDIDNFVMYPADNQTTGANDVVAPGAVTGASANALTPADVLINWSAPATGIDSGGYIVVRYTTQPTGNDNPLQNAIYAIGDTVTGTNIGVVSYIGKGTSIDDNFNVLGGTTYYYKIYAADKAFNYSAAASVQATTSSYSYFYYNGTGALENTASWGKNTDGSGAHPSDFITSGQYFYLQNATGAVTLSNPWTVSGSSSKIILGSATQPAINFTVAATGSLTAKMDVLTPSTGRVALNINGGLIPTFGVVTGNPDLTVGTTVNTTIPKVNYNNVTISSPSSVIVNIADTLLVNNLTINAGSVLSTTTKAGSSLSPITVAAGGLVTINGTLMTGKTTGLYSTTSVATLNFLSGTSNYVLGPNSTIVYDKVASTTNQTITAANYANLTIAGASPKVFEAAAFKISGNLVYTNTGNPSATPTSPTSIEFNGTGVQNIDSIPAPYFSDVTFSGGGLKKLHTSVVVNGIITFVNGKLDVGTDTFTITPLATIGSGVAGSYILTGNSASGRVLLQGIGISSPVTVPVGSPNNYLPVTLTPGSSSYEMAVAAFDGLTTDGTYGGTPVNATAKAQSINAFWNISSTSGTGNVKVEVNWPASIEGSTFTTAPNNQIKLVEFNGTKWVPGSFGTANNTSNIASDSFSTFTVFTVTQTPGTLPVSSVKLNLSKVNNAVKVYWNTLNEINTVNCIVERSTDGINFTPVYTVNAAGNAAQNSYTFPDHLFKAGANYYRIKITSQDGGFFYSNVGVISISSNPVFVILGNPVAKNNIAIQANAIEDGKYNLLLTNAAGQILSAKEVTITGNAAILNLYVPGNLVSGTYYVRVTGASVNNTIPVIIK